jgi:hypothetical protein
VDDFPGVLHSKVAEKPAISMSTLNTVTSNQKGIHIQVKYEAGKKGNNKIENIELVLMK